MTTRVPPILRYLTTAFFGYIAVSVLIILPALNIFVPRMVSDTLHRQLRSDIVLFNPFSLTLEVRNATLLEPDGETFLTVDRALVNLSVESIWRKGWVLDAVAVDSLDLHIRYRTNGSFNFSDMFSDDENAETAITGTSGEGIPALTVHRLSLDSNRIKITDEARDVPFTTHWDGLAVTVDELSTVFEPGSPYRLDVVGEYGGKLHWQGQVSVPGGYSEGTLSIENFNLHPISRYLRPWVALELKEGYLDIAGNYRLDWGDELAYRVSKGRVSLSHIDIQPQDTDRLPGTAVQLEKFVLRGVDIDGTSERVEIATADIEGVSVQGFSEASDVSLPALFEIRLPGDYTQADSEGDADWSVHIPRVNVSESRLSWRSEFTSPSVMEISPLSFQLTDLSWPPVGETKLDLSLAINKVATLSVTGGVLLDSGAGNLHYQLENLQPAWFNPNIPQAFKAKISQGAAKASGEVTLVDFLPGRLRMDGAVTDFSGIIEGAEDALTSWNSVSWQGLDINFGQHSVQLDSLNLDGYNGRLHIYEDGTVNTQRVLQEEVAAAREEGGASEEQEESEEWAFDSASIEVNDSQLDFQDESLPINFRTVIGDLNGDITGLSSKMVDETVIDLKGSVDGYAPVVLQGTARPFAEPAFMDIGLSFDGVDLIRLTPYSGTYAGYAIDRGILSLDLHYSLDSNQLNGDNSVVIEQLKLGRKIESDKAVDLPLQLAIALLTDMDGVMGMDVPVSGNLDDPEFGLGSVIFSAFVNMITKAVTAPFALLANLVGSEEDMQRINFASGSNELDEAARSRLADLTSALEQRPAINLVLIGRLHPSADRERLQRDLLNAELEAAGLSAQDEATKSALWVETIKTRYRRLPGASLTNADGLEISTRKQYQQLAASITVADEQLKELAEGRAVAVKRYLVNELQLAADRSVIELVDVSAEENVFSGVELGVDI